MHQIKNKETSSCAHEVALFAAHQGILGLPLRDPADCPGKVNPESNDYEKAIQQANAKEFKACAIKNDLFSADNGMRCSQFEKPYPGPWRVEAQSDHAEQKEVDDKNTQILSASTFELAVSLWHYLLLVILSFSLCSKKMGRASVFSSQCYWHFFSSIYSES